MATKKYELAKFNDGNDSTKLSRGEPVSPNPAKHIILARTESFSKIAKSKNDDPGLLLGIKEHVHYPEMGAIDGVLLPFLQSNMVGAILFIRLPYITGQAGVVLAAVIFIICVMSTSLTLLSLSALASNGKINKSGGLYQLVSRNLGLELGGATGLLFYLGKCLAGSMYCLGASETFLTGLGLKDQFPWDHQIIALAMCLILTLIAHFLDSKYIDRMGHMFLVIAALTILFFTIGGFAFADQTWNGSIDPYGRITNDNPLPQFTHDEMLRYTPTFFSMLALYYPSVTGIMTGSNRP
eukprot:gene8954-18525_t